MTVISTVIAKVHLAPVSVSKSHTELSSCCLLVLPEAGHAVRTMPAGEVATAAGSQHLPGPLSTSDHHGPHSGSVGALTALRHSLTEGCRQTGPPNGSVSMCCMGFACTCRAEQAAWAMLGLVDESHLKLSTNVKCC